MGSAVSEPSAGSIGRSAPAGHDSRFGSDPLLFETMSGTRAMRRLSPEPVPDAMLRRLIEAATWAPTGSNEQAESFVLVTDRLVMERLARFWRGVVDDFLAMNDAVSPERVAEPSNRRIRSAIEYQRDHFAETPAVIVACYDFSRTKRLRRSPRAVRALVRAFGARRFLALSRTSTMFMQRSEAASIYPAVQNLLLAARAQGLAACMTTWHLMDERGLKTLLGIPDDVETFAVIPVGWPLGSFGPVRRREVEEVVHRDRW